MKKIYFLLFMAMALIWQMDAQIETPALSPSAKFEQSVGLAKVSVEYSRPSMRGRTIFGGLVPYGDMWRTGANASTKITFDNDVKIGGNKLEAGTYALYTIPGEKTWEIIFHKNLTHWGVGGKNYNAEEDALRVSVEAYDMGDMSVETFTMGIGKITSNGAKLNIMWETTMVQVPFELNTKEQVQASIDKALAGPAGQDYYSAAQYYFTEGIDNEKALKWVNMAIENDYKGFWVLKMKSEIQAATGDKAGAIKTAKASMMAAEEAGNSNYVNMNKKNIEKWNM